MSYKLYSSFYTKEASDVLFGALLDQICWTQDSVLVYNKEHKIPRLHSFIGDSGLTYKWSGLNMKNNPWFPEILSVKKDIEQKLDCRFNSLVANLYRDGQDTVGWHSDDDYEFGECPTIASVSFGVARDFILKHKTTKEKVKFTLKHGDLFIMSGRTQRDYLHSLPRRKNVKDPRINLTFRNMETK